MSITINSSNSLKTLSKAVSLVTFAGFSSYSQAVDFGRTNILSKQYQPLNASITVDNIDEKNFDVSMANQAIYQQMGLDPNTNVNVNFVRTSDTSGKIVLSSSTAINEPFADIVLKIKENDSKQFMPKTLLMPTGVKPQAPQQQQMVMDSQQNQNLPLVANSIATPISNAIIEPRVRPNSTGLVPTIEMIPQPQKTNEPPIQAHEIAALNQTRNQIEQIKVQKNNNIQAHQNTHNSTTSTQAQTQKPPVFSTSRVSSEPPIGALATDKYVQNNTQQANNTNASNKPVAVQNKPNSTPKGNHTYVVQRNDNLWTIANEIAKSNKTSINKVMQEIHAQNPKAFINGNKSRIIANAKLVLPDYKVVPSQKGLQDAISARRGATRNEPRTQQNRVSTPSRTTANTPRRPTTPPRVALVAPKNEKTTTSTSTNGTSSRANNGLISQLRSSRQNTAEKVTNVSSLSNKVDSYSQKLQLQNKKLAELEARLKQLKGQ